MAEAYSKEVQKYINFLDSKKITERRLFSLKMILNSKHTTEHERFKIIELINQGIELESTHQEKIIKAIKKIYEEKPENIIEKQVNEHIISYYIDNYEKIILSDIQNIYFSGMNFEPFYTMFDKNKNSIKFYFSNNKLIILK